MGHRPHRHTQNRLGHGSLKRTPRWVNEPNNLMVIGDARAELLEVESANTAFNDVVQARPINVERESATEEDAARRK